MREQASVVDGLGRGHAAGVLRANEYPGMEMMPERGPPASAGSMVMQVALALSCPGLGLAMPSGLQGLSNVCSMVWNWRGTAAAQVPPMGV